MVIELSFQNRNKKRRRVQILMEYTSIEEMLIVNPRLLPALIEHEKMKTECLEQIKKIDL